MRRSNLIKSLLSVSLANSSRKMQRCAQCTRLSIHCRRCWSNLEWQERSHEQTNTSFQHAFPSTGKQQLNHTALHTLTLHFTYFHSSVHTHKALHLLIKNCTQHITFISLHLLMQLEEMQGHTTTGDSCSLPSCGGSGTWPSIKEVHLGNKLFNKRYRHSDTV